MLDEYEKEGQQTKKKKEEASLFCHYCGKSLANKSNLKRHVINQHSKEVGITPVSNVFTCHYCKCSFSNKSSVKRHIENLHSKNKDTRKSISCFRCEQRFNSIKNLNAHLTIEHDVEIQERKLRFDNLSDFWNWKQEEEIRTNARFIQLRGLRRQHRKGEKISNLKFVCNRSGIFNSKSNGKRANRMKGSSKIGRYCSAYVEIMYQDNASVDGTYCSTHSGHENDLRYLALSMDDKREIYEKIKSGESFTSILNEIRDSVGKEITRRHLVTNKDLHNIVTTFKKLTEQTEKSSETKSFLNDTNYVSNADAICNLPDRCFGNDLDICADLWVETCQDMISLGDQNQSKVSKLRNINLTNCAGTVSDGASSKITFHTEMYSSSAPNSTKSNRFDFLSNFSQSDGFPSNISSYTPSPTAQSLSDINSSWPKQHVYVTHRGEEVDSSLDFIGSASPFQNNSLQSVSSGAIPKELPDFYGIQNPLNHVQSPKDFYSIDVCPSSNNERKNILICDGIKNTYPSIFNISRLSVENTASIATSSASIGGYQRAINSNILSPTNEFHQPYASPEKDATTIENSFSHSEEFDDGVSKRRKSDFIATAAQTKLLDWKVEKKNCLEVSNLRDRVNSVTALYNIVESELDERKKSIIRSYVDNMFRVLQYRYNKYKTKKKKRENEKS